MPQSRKDFPSYCGCGCFGSFCCYGGSLDEEPYSHRISCFRRYCRPSLSTHRPLRFRRRDGHLRYFLIHLQVSAWWFVFHSSVNLLSLFLYFPSHRVSPSRQQNDFFFMPSFFQISNGPPTTFSFGRANQNRTNHFR